jgi:hypothetical protein
MMGDDDLDCGDVAMDLGAILEGDEWVKQQGWQVDALDIGEITVTTPCGQRFRLTVEEVIE